MIKKEIKYNHIKNLLCTIYGYNINDSIDELHLLAQFPQDLYWENQKNKRNHIVKYHYENTPWYKNYIGDMSKWDWSEIPIVTKEALQDFSLKYYSNEKNEKKTYQAKFLVGKARLQRAIFKKKLEI